MALTDSPASFVVSMPFLRIVAEPQSRTHNSNPTSDWGPAKHNPCGSFVWICSLSLLPLKFGFDRIHWLNLTLFAPFSQLPKHPGKLGQSPLAVGPWANSASAMAMASSLAAINFSWESKCKESETSRTTSYPWEWMLWNSIFTWQRHWSWTLRLPYFFWLWTR